MKCKARELMKKTERENEFIFNMVAATAAYSSIALCASVSVRLCVSVKMCVRAS